MMTTDREWLDWPLVASGRAPGADPRMTQLDSLGVALEMSLVAIGDEAESSAETSS